MTSSSIHPLHPLHPRDHEDTSRVCIQWLEKMHRKGILRATNEWLDLIGPDGVQIGGFLDAAGATMLSINAGEWLLARGEIFARGETRSINTYLLSRDGPPLSPGQQRWLAQLRERPLRLYRVTDVRPGARLTLVDELNAGEPPLEVREISGSRDVALGTLIGVRLMTVGEPQYQQLELSGAAYVFSKPHELRVLEAVADTLEGSAALGLHPDNQRDGAEIEIARAWLAQWLPLAPTP